MKNTFVFLFALITGIAAISSSAINADFAGTWDYVVTGTPDGNVPGTFTINQVGDSYTGTVTVGDGSVSMENLEAKGDQLTFSVSIEGAVYEVALTFKGDKFSGTVKFQGESFSISGAKK